MAEPCQWSNHGRCLARCTSLSSIDSVCQDGLATVPLGTRLIVLEQLLLRPAAAAHLGTQPVSVYCISISLFLSFDQRIPMFGSTHYGASRLASGLPELDWCYHCLCSFRPVYSRSRLAGWRRHSWSCSCQPIRRSGQSGRGCCRRSACSRFSNKGATVAKPARDAVPAWRAKTDIARRSGIQRNPHGVDAICYTSVSGQIGKRTACKAQTRARSKPVVGELVQTDLEAVHQGFRSHLTTIESLTL